VLSTPQDLGKNSRPQFSQLYIGTRTPKPSIPVTQSILVDGTVRNTQWNANTLLATDSTKALKSAPVGANLSIQNNTFNVSPYSVFSSINLNSGSIRYYNSGTWDATVFFKGQRTWRSNFSFNTFRWTIINNTCTIELTPALGTPGTNNSPLFGGLISFNFPAFLCPPTSSNRCIFPILVQNQGKYELGNIQLFNNSTAFVCPGVNFGGLAGFPEQNTQVGWNKTVYLTYELGAKQFS
jgi:hypothetical protein